MRRSVAVILTLLLAFAVALSQSSNSPKDTKKPTKEEIEALKLFNSGNSFLRSGNYDKAIEKYDSAIALVKDPRFYYQKGIALKALKKYDEALQAFQEAINLQNDFAYAYNGMAGIYLMRRDYDKAIENYEKALTYNQKLKVALRGIVEALIGKANKLIKLGKFQDALDLLNKATMYRPDYYKIYTVMALVNNRLAKYEDAVKAAKKAIELKKKGLASYAYFELGIAYKNLGKIEEARKAFLQAKKDPRLARNAQYELDYLKKK